MAATAAGPAGNSTRAQRLHFFLERLAKTPVNGQLATMASLDERLERIRSSPRLQNQQQTAVVLAAIEDTLRQQAPRADLTPAGYFAALLALLAQHISASKGIVNREVATSIVYLLDLITPHVPAPLLRAKFTQILESLVPALVHPDAEAPLLRASIGCLESLLVVQDAQAWALPASQVSPRRAVAGLLQIAVDHRPKVRKRAQEALSNVLKRPPPSPSLDHPAADMCAETAVRKLKDLVDESRKTGKHRRHDHTNYDAALIHTLQLIKTIASASGGWPGRKIDALCELLLDIAKSSSEYLIMAAFEVFEAMFAGMADELSSAKLPRLLETIRDLQPSHGDAHLVPPWLAVMSRGYDVSAQRDADETFQKLPDLFRLVSSFLSSHSHDVRISTSECLTSFLHNCIPPSVILEPSIYDEKTLEKLGKASADLLSVKYQTAWMEVFGVLEALFETLRWRSVPLLSAVVRTVGDLRSNSSFTGKTEADAVLATAIRAMGPDNVLEILPLNLTKPLPGQPGRAWLLPIMRDSVSNTRLAHFRSELVPLSEAMFQKVLDHGKAEKSMEIKIFETLVHQIWAVLPGYCDLPLDLTDAFDQSFAELLSNLLYQQVELRTDICHALQNLVDSNRAIVELPGEDDLLVQSRVSKASARENLNFLAGFAGNLLAVLFNVYSETLPQFRDTILRCINAYLSLSPEKELVETFERVIALLETSLKEIAPQTQAEREKDRDKTKMPPATHTLMDLVVTMSIYLPRQSFGTLFGMAAAIINTVDDQHLQKKAYKLIPRLAESDAGKQALTERNAELQQLLLSSAEKASAPARRDRLEAIATIVRLLPSDDLHFIPSVLPEVVISTKEVKEKARTTAFDLLVSMGEKMAGGGTVHNSKVPNMDPDAPSVDATLEEFFTMVSAGLAGSTPHSVSATITALSRILYEFRETLSEATLINLVETMDLFLTHNNREIVGSALGFVKISVLSLPVSLMEPRLKSLIEHLLLWSKEHKARFQLKVKHIIERMMRRFGVDAVEKNCPEEGKKLIHNIKKIRERRKRKKQQHAEDDADAAGQSHGNKKQSRFESSYDQAVYGSEDGESESGSDVSDDDILGRKRKAKKESGTYIVEDEDEPLDLLDRRALGHISSTKPVRAAKHPTQRKSAKMDLDGRLVINEDQVAEEAAADEMDLDPEKDIGDGTLEGGINAYVEAIRGQDAARRGQRGKLKFSNRKRKDGDDGNEMEVDGEEVQKVKKKVKEAVAMGSDMKTGMQKAKMQRRGLGAQKVRGGRVAKAGRGGRR